MDPVICGIFVHNNKKYCAEYFYKLTPYVRFPEDSKALQILKKYYIKKGKPLKPDIKVEVCKPFEAHLVQADNANNDIFPIKEVQFIAMQPIVKDVIIYHQYAYDSIVEKDVEENKQQVDGQFTCSELNDFIIRCGMNIELTELKEA